MSLTRRREKRTQTGTRTRESDSACPKGASCRRLRCRFRHPPGRTFESRRQLTKRSRPPPRPRWSWWQDPTRSQTSTPVTLYHDTLHYRAPLLFSQNLFRYILSFLGPVELSVAITVSHRYHDDPSLHRRRLELMPTLSRKPWLRTQVWFHGPSGETRLINVFCSICHRINVPRCSFCGGQTPQHTSDTHVLPWKSVDVAKPRWALDWERHLCSCSPDCARRLVEIFPEAVLRVASFDGVPTCLCNLQYYTNGGIHRMPFGEVPPRDCKRGRRLSRDQILTIVHKYYLYRRCFSHLECGEDRHDDVIRQIRDEYGDVVGNSEYAENSAYVYAGLLKGQTDTVVTVLRTTHPEVLHMCRELIQRLRISEERVWWVEREEDLDVEPGPEPGPELDISLDAILDAEPDLEPDPEPDPQLDPEPGPQPDPEPGPQPGPKLDPATDINVDQYFPPYTE